MRSLSLRRGLRCGQLNLQGAEQVDLDLFQLYDLPLD